MPADFASRWQRLDLRDAERLRTARRQAHHALQLVSGVGRSYLPFIDTEEFANVGWDRRLSMFVGRAVGKRWKFRAALRPADLSLHVLTPQGRDLSELSLHGATFDDALRWLRARLAELGADPDALTMDAPFDIPEYATHQGAAFDAEDGDAFREVARHYTNASLFLDHVADRFPLYLPVRIWPHHFDIATRRRFRSPAGPWHMGVAYSLGDAHNYPDPYFSLTRYPRPKPPSLPELPGGSEWHDGDRWLGVVLPGAYVSEPRTGPAQATRALEVIEVGMPAVEALPD